MNEKSDYYVFDTRSKFVYDHDLTLKEALSAMNDISIDFPDDLPHFVVASVSEDPILAVKRAFAHIDKH